MVYIPALLRLAIRPRMTSKYVALKDPLDGETAGHI